VHDHLKETNQAITEIEAMGLAKVRNTAARVSIQHLEKLGYMKRVGGGQYLGHSRFDADAGWWLALSLWAPG
jgi:predicted transcriptional regulator of viral defense system